MFKAGNVSHKRWPLVFLLVAALALLAFVAAACGDDDEEGDAHGGAAASVVNVSFIEWSVIPDVGSVPAGSVTFDVTNDSSSNHELVVIRTDLAPDALPVVEHKVDEDQVEVIGRIEEFAPGATESATFDLEPGNYVLICNLEERGQFDVVFHYELGERTAFEVTE